MTPNAPDLHRPGPRGTWAPNPAASYASMPINWPGRMGGVVGTKPQAVELLYFFDA